MIVMPADHVIKDEKSFQLTIASALPLAENGTVVALGGHTA
jgi:mannose-1-phosphate guanylyltransferase